MSFELTRLPAASASGPVPGFSVVGLPPAPPLGPDALAAALAGQLPPPHPALRASVVVPARNEADALPLALAALATQIDLRGQPLPPGTFEVVVLANNCTDATAAVARHAGRQHPALILHVVELHLPPAEAHIGRARRLLMDAACQRLLAVGRPGGLILSTDADTTVAVNWLAANQAAIRSGADAVGGRILTAPGPAADPARALRLRDAAYRLLCAQLEHRLDPQSADPWPRHHQHFGASLALTARAYQRVGGLPVRRYLEDEALCQLLRRHDLRLRHSPQVRVHTSPRHCGRVEVGLSWQLREWADLHTQRREPVVDCPHHLADLWRNRRQLWTLWAYRTGLPPATGYAALAAALQVPAKALAAQARASLTFGRLWEWVTQARAEAGIVPQQVPLSQAVREVRQVLAQPG